MNAPPDDWRERMIELVDEAADLSGFRRGKILGGLAADVERALLEVSREALAKRRAIKTAGSGKVIQLHPGGRS